MNSEKLQYIIDCLSTEELLCQLAEEAAELSHAALKHRRTLSDTNPTPVSKEDSIKNLLEEIADVKLCLHVGGFEKVRDKIQVNRIISAKAERWLKRLMGEVV